MSFSLSVRSALRRSGFTGKQVALLEANVGGSGGGGDSNIVQQTAVPDQTIAITTPGQPQDVAVLWRLAGPGLFAVCAWAEFKPAGDNDMVGLTLLNENDDEGSNAVQMGPFARAFTSPHEMLAGGWIRAGTAQVFPVTIWPSQWHDYKLQIAGWAYNEVDPGDTTGPPSGNPQIRNTQITAVRLDV
jgi:hypothetical protein